MLDEKEPHLWLALDEHKTVTTIARFTIVGTLSASALSLYHYDPACHGGWGACREAHHLEYSATATGQVSGIDHWNSHG